LRAEPASLNASSNSVQNAPNAREHGIVTTALERERPKPYDSGYSFFLILNSKDLRSALKGRIAECQRRADLCSHPLARAEWLDHIKSLRALLAEEK
jgi:hypothetical protein